MQTIKTAAVLLFVCIGCLLGFVTQAGVALVLIVALTGAAMTLADLTNGHASTVPPHGPATPADSVPLDTAAASDAPISASPTDEERRAEIAALRKSIEEKSADEIIQQFNRTYGAQTYGDAVTGALRHRRP